MFKIFTTLAEDHHMHSLNYSDGMNTIDEMVVYAGKLGLSKITITDHSQVMIEKKGFALKAWRTTIKRWENVHNTIQVQFGVEGDLLDQEGNCCFDIQGKESDFCILSCHKDIFSGDLEQITQAYSNSLDKYHDKIALIGHPCAKKTSFALDIPVFASLLNKYNIPIEINCSYLKEGKTDREKLKHLLSLLETGVYVNSDTHTLADLHHRILGYEFLKEYGYLM